MVKLDGAAGCLLFSVLSELTDLPPQDVMSKILCKQTCKNMTEMGECLSWPQLCRMNAQLSLYPLNCTCFDCCLGFQQAVNHACQSGDASDDSVMSSAGLTCL